MAAYINPEEAAKAKQMDLFTYLSLAQPDELIHKGGNHYTTKSHDSLDISNGFWKRWSTGDGGKTAVDYLIKVEGYSFQEAVQKVNSLTGFNPLDVRPTEQKKSTVKKEFILPEKNTDNKRVIAYLKSRGIHSDVLQYYIKHQYLYEEKKYHNAVFIGYSNGQAKYAFLRGTCGSEFKGEVAGSDKRYGFSVSENASSGILHVYECAIDLLSYCSMCQMVNQDWKRDFHLSQGGIFSKSENGNIGKALETFLINHPDIKKVYLRYDNDDKGYEAAIATQRILQQKYGLEAEIKLPKRGKDYNEYLQDALKKLQNKEYPLSSPPFLKVKNNTPNDFVKKKRAVR